MEAVPELPEIKSEIKAEDFISANNQSPHGQSHTPNLVEQIQNPANCGWVGLIFIFTVSMFCAKFAYQICLAFLNAGLSKTYISPQKRRKLKLSFM